MACFDVFNGDADGICSLHQLRLAEPRECTLITGVKRDIGLLERIRDAAAGDTVTVLDLSLDRNRVALQTLLARGVTITYVDHHFSGEIPAHPALHATIETTPEVCTAILVNRMLHGRFPAWAAVAAFGDNLASAASLALSPERLALLRELGMYLNYNAYGDSVDDLHFHPAELYRRLRPYADPFDFIAGETVFAALKQGYEADIGLARARRPEWARRGGTVYILPDQPWSRRVGGAFGNELARGAPESAHAILTPGRDGGFTVSVRAPLARPEGADELCRRFASGGGRRAAAGINHLPANELTRFLAEFDATFNDGHTS